MKTILLIKKLMILLVILVFLALILSRFKNFLSVEIKPVYAQSSFRFLAWADTKNSRSDLSRLANQIARANINPRFMIYPGDLQDSGFYVTGDNNINHWKCALNGLGSSNDTCADGEGTGFFLKTFPTRGNHDSSDMGGWQNYFNMNGIRSNVGATNYSYLSGKDDLVYSFDYDNSHFVALDATGSIGSLTSDQFPWLLQDLINARKRGLVHAFVWFHGPVYCIEDHCSCYTRTCNVDSDTESFINIVNGNNPDGSNNSEADAVGVAGFVSATFHGHEHTNSYTFIDETRIPSESGFDGILYPFYQFINGSAGAGPGDCFDSATPEGVRYDYCMRSASNQYDSEHGFLVIDVNGLNITASFYRMNLANPDTGMPILEETINFTKGDLPSPSSGTIPSPSASANPVLSPSPSSSIAPSSSPSPGTTSYDLNQDGSVDGKDVVELLSNWYSNIFGIGDYVKDNLINTLDFVTLIKYISSPLLHNFQTRISSSSDDAEQCISTTGVYLTSSDIEMVRDDNAGGGSDCTGDQIVGLRFINVTIPKGSTIQSAYIQFTVDEISTDPTNLTIWGEAIDNSPTFVSTANNISTRTKTLSFVSNWTPNPWNSTGQAGVDQQTPNLKTIIQEIIQRPNWNSGYPISIIIEGSGQRTAVSFNASSSKAPQLVVEYY